MRRRFPLTAVYFYMARLLLVFALALAVLPSRSAQAQASLSCPMQPHTLGAMLHCYRPLLVFAPSATNMQLRRQTNLLAHSADSMMDRFIVITPIVPDPARYVTPLDAPYVLLPEREMQVIRRQFHIPLNKFEVVQLGELGQPLLRSSRPVSIDPLKSVIDVLPLRKIEETRRGAN